MEGDEEEEEDPDDDYYVRTFTWTPRAGQQEAVLDVCNATTAGEKFTFRSSSGGGILFCRDPLLRALPRTVVELPMELK